MASSLIGNFNSGYIASGNRFTPGPSSVRVIVEDETDVPLWNAILKHNHPLLNFEISPFNLSGVEKGKGHILRLAPNLGPNLIGCVDSDHDFLLHRHLPEGILLMSNQYLFQTFGYSRENLALVPTEVNHLLCASTLHSNAEQAAIDSVYSDFLNSISVAVYPLLEWLLYLQVNHAKDYESDGKYGDVFNNGLYNQIITEGKRLNRNYKDVLTDIATAFSNNVGAKVAIYEATYSGEIADKEAFINGIKEDVPELTPGNAWVFVRGHDIYDFMLHVFFKHYEQQLVNEHKQNIINHASAKDQIENLLKHYTNNLTGVEKLLQSDTRFLTSGALPVYNRLISQRIQ